MTKATLKLDTALGSFLFVAMCDNPPGEVSLDLKTFERRLSLPPEMSVQRCRAVMLRVSTRVDVATLTWSCESPRGVAGGPNTGQYLDAQAWEANGRLVMVGTEDEEALALRLGFLQLNPDMATVAHYSPHKLEMRIARIPAATTFGLHFILAENPSPEPVEMSAWFAVNIPHIRLTAPDAA